MNYKQFWIAFSSTILLICTLTYFTYSCGWIEDECDSYVSFTNPNIVSVKNAEMYYYSPFSKFYACEGDSANQSNYALDDRNVAEWILATSKTVTEKDLHAFIYSYSYASIAELYYYIEKNKSTTLPDSMSSNTFSTWFLQTKNLEVLGYIMYAKQCEKVSVVSNDGDWEIKPIDTIQCRKLIKNGLQLFTVAKQNDIKKRYAFQLIKIAFYANDFKQVIALYANNYLPLQGSSSIDERCNSFYAGALFHTEQNEKAALLFAMNFINSKDFANRNSYAVAYNWAVAKCDSTKLFALASTKEEKKSLLLMRSLRNTELFSLATIKNVVEIDPNNDLLDMLLMREINKLEKEFVDFKYTVERGYPIYDSYMFNLNGKIDKEEFARWLSMENNAKTQLLQFTDYLESTAAKNTISNKSLWLACAGYLHMLNDKYDKAEADLKEAESAHPSEKVANQIRIFKLICTIEKEPKMSPEVEQNIVKDVEWFEDLASKNRIFAKPHRDLLRTILPLKYAATKDTIKMMLCYHKFENQINYSFDQDQAEPNKATHFSEQYSSISGSLMDNYFSSSMLDVLKKYNTTSTSSFEKWLTRKNVYTDDVINELKAVKYFRKFDYASARNTLVNNANLPVVPNLFVAHIRDYQDGYDEDTLHYYSLLEVLDTLQSLRQISVSNFEAAYNYACALYSLSYHGKCHDAWTFHRDYTALEPYYFSGLDAPTAFDLQYYYADEAYQQFQRVYASSSNKDMKQRALWMMAKCFQKRYPTPIENDYSGESEVAYANWSTHSNIHFVAFLQQYKGTPFYEQVYNECSYFSNFVSKK